MADKSSIIPKGWKMTTLGEVLDIKNGKSRPDDGTQYPVYGGNGILGYADEYNNDKKIIIVGRVGAYCGSIYSEKEKIWLSDNALGVLAKEKSNIDFLYYLLKKINLNKQATGGAQPLLTQEVINQIETLLPEAEAEQRAIAAVLASLDDKIELLREQNKTLEATAQAIFKEWFVNFNFPNAEGKPYKASGGKMIVSGLGEIPEGWRVQTLGNILTLQYGSALVAENRNKGEIPVYGSSGIVGYHDKFLVDGPGIIVGRAGIPGSVYWSQINFFCMDSTFFVKTEDLYLYYFYYLLKVLKLNRLQSGSAVPGLNRNNAYELDVVMPNNDVLNKFNGFVKIIFEKLSFNDSQIQTLSALRDTLLPKLMKGEVRVKGFKE